MGSGGYSGPPRTAQEWRTKYPNFRPTQDEVLPEAPVTPDLTDATVQRAALAQRRRLMTAGAGSTFLTGPTGAGPFTGDTPTGSGS